MMFGSNSLRAGGPSSIAELLALASLAPGGGAQPPLPANPAAGGQNDMGVMPQPRPSPGMFGSAPPGVGQMGRGMPAKPPTSNSEAAVTYQHGMAANRAAPYGQQPRDGPPSPPFGDDMPSVLGQGSIAPNDPFALGLNIGQHAQPPHIKSKAYNGLFPGKDWVSIVGILGDALAGAAGRPATFGPMMMRQREAEQEHNRNLDLWRQKMDYERQERMRPRVEQVGSSLGVLNPDPANPSFNPVYQVPGAAEQYAVARGFQPGSPDYADAVQEYRLGSWSDPAMEAKTELENVRYGNRDALQDDRLAVTRRGQDIRSGDARRGQNMTDSRTRRGQDMTDERTRGSASYQGRGGKGRGAGAAPAGGSDLIGPVYVRGQVRVRWSKAQNKYVRVP